MNFTELMGRLTNLASFGESFFLILDKKGFDGFLPNYSFVAKIMIQSINKSEETKRGHIWKKEKVAFSIFSAGDPRKISLKMNKKWGKFSKYFKLFLTKNHKTMSYDFSKTILKICGQLRKKL
jgi:hypothetical protein